jgi:hypothetical protein
MNADHPLGLVLPDYSSTLSGAIDGLKAELRRRSLAEAGLSAYDAARLTDRDAAALIAARRKRDRKLARNRAARTRS